MELRINLTDKMYRDLKQRAKKEDMNLNNYIGMMVRLGIQLDILFKKYLDSEL